MNELISRLTWADYLTAVAVLRGAWVGYKSGLLPELLRIVAYAVTVVVTLYYYDPLAQMITLKSFLNVTSATAVAFFALFVLTFIVTKLASMLLIKILNAGEGGIVYRLLGMLIGACRWVILLSLTFMLINYLPLEPLKKDIDERSVVGQKVAKIAPMLFQYVSSLTPQLKKL